MCQPPANSLSVYAGVLINGTSTISVTCTNSTTYNVGLNAGTATGATVTTRKMTGPGSNVLNYALYSNSGHTTNWGNTVGTNTVAGTGTGLVQTLTVYGQLSSKSERQSGSYAYTICRHYLPIDSPKPVTKRKVNRLPAAFVDTGIE